MEVGGHPQSVSLGTSNLKERYWFKAAEEIGKRLNNPGRALIVGIGGATIFHLLSQKFSELELVGVELDPEIIKVSRKFFGLDEIKNLKVIIGDGENHITTELARRQGSRAKRGVLITPLAGEGSRAKRGVLTNDRGSKFDLTFIDAYLGGNFPSHFQEESFLRQLREITNLGGLIVINRVRGFDRDSFRERLASVLLRWRW